LLLKILHKFLTDLYFLKRTLHVHLVATFLVLEILHLKFKLLEHALPLGFLSALLHFALVRGLELRTDLLMRVWIWSLFRFYFSRRKNRSFVGQSSHSLEAGL